MNTPKKPRRVPRIPTEEAMHDESSAKHWDHLGSGTVPPPFCRWGARGMRCDCLICAETMTTTKSPEVIATMEHYRRDVLLPCGHVAVLRLSAAISTLAKPVADVPVKELARRGAEERFDQAVKGINGIKCPECGRVSSPERYNRPVER